ncbi:MipA/OmpV family protein [Paraburkholderia terrae]
MYQSLKPIGALSLTLRAIVGSLVVVSAVARAQTHTDATTNSSAVSQILGANTDISVGIGAGVDQRYMGSREFRFEVLPTFDISRGIFLADSIRGVGVQYETKSGFYVSQTFNYDFGRAEANSLFRPGADNLKGMGDVKGAVTTTTTVSQRITPWLSVNAQAEFGLDGHERGNQYQFGIESRVMQFGADTITADFDAKLGDAKFNQTYFGVTPTQSVASGFNRYTPGSGIYAYSLTMTWDHMLDKHWSTEAVLSATRYTNKAAESPIVQRKIGIEAFTSVDYKF